METKVKPLQLRIVTPFGVEYDSNSKPDLIIKSIVSRGVIPSKGNFFQGEEIFDFEILPDHTPFIAKISEKSSIKVSTNQKDLLFHTVKGGVVTVMHSNDFTNVLFTLQDVKEEKEK